MWGQHHSCYQARSAQQLLLPKLPCGVFKHFKFPRLLCTFTATGRYSDTVTVTVTVTVTDTVRCGLVDHVPSGNKYTVTVTVTVTVYSPGDVHVHGYGRGMFYSNHDEKSESPNMIQIPLSASYAAPNIPVHCPVHH
jgi:hypothetical protein